MKRINQEAFAALTSLLGSARARRGGEIGEDYARDEMPEYGLFPPEALLLPENEAEVAQILRICDAYCVPVTPRGAGTGLCGGCAPVEGGVVLSTERMNRLLEIDPVNMTARVQPGLLLMEFNQRLAGTGLFYPPDPGEKTATLGGNAMTNAGGMRAVRYGVTRDYVLGMRVALPGGEVLDLGGKTVKSSSGLSLINLMIGSEGTLGVATELTLKLTYEPGCNLSLLVPFADFDRCVAAVPDVLRCGAEPTAVEFMEREVILASETYLGKAFPDRNAPAYLLIRLDGPDEARLKPLVELLTELLLKLGASDVLLADTEERKSAIWDARGAFLEAIKGGTASLDECDVVVPRERIADFVRRANEIGRETGVRVRSFGHAGDGNLHVYVLRDDLSAEQWQKKRARAMDCMYARARELGGQVSGEHGVGHAKRGYLLESLGETQLRLMRGIKDVFDPKHIMNPGKVV